MSTAQTVYLETPAKGIAGMVANEEKCNKISRTVETAAGILFGQPAFRGVGDHGCVAGATFAATGAGSAAAGNTGANTITASPAVAAGAKAGRWVLTAVTAGASAVWLFSDPDGIERGEVTTAVAATIGGIGPFTIADPGTDAAIGDQMYIDVTYTANTKFLGLTVLTPAVAVAGNATVLDGYIQYSTAALMTDGQMYVTAGASVTPGQAVYWNPATSRFTANPAHIPIPAAFFDTTSTDGNVVEVSLKHRSA